MTGPRMAHRGLMLRLLAIVLQGHVAICSWHERDAGSLLCKVCGQVCLWRVMEVGSGGRGEKHSEDKKAEHREAIAESQKEFIGGRW